MDIKAVALWVDRMGRDYWRHVQAISTSFPEKDVTTEVLWSKPRVQIERITIAPFGIVPLHRHPLVDSYEFPLWGRGEIWLNRRRYKLDEETTPWRSLFVSRSIWHGGCSTDNKGGAFLSVQHWHVPLTGSIRASWEERC